MHHVTGSMPDRHLTGKLKIGQQSHNAFTDFKMQIQMLEFSGR